MNTLLLLISGCLTIGASVTLGVLIIDYYLNNKAK